MSDGRSLDGFGERSVLGGRVRPVFRVLATLFVIVAAVALTGMVTQLVQTGRLAAMSFPVAVLTLFAMTAMTWLFGMVAFVGRPPQIGSRPFLLATGGSFLAAKVLAWLGF